MEMKDLKDALLDSIKENVSLKHFNWFKTGGFVKWFFIPKNLEQLQFFLQNKPSNLRLFVLGAGSNLLVDNNNMDLCVIKLTNFNSIVMDENNQIFAQGGVLNLALSKFALQNSIANFEFLSGIPGTIGGGIAMNAGAFEGEFKDIITKVYAIDYSGGLHEFSNQQMGFGYRKNSLKNDFIFYNAQFTNQKGDETKIKTRLDYIAQTRQSTQPKKVFTGGSTFANPVGYKAWELIDKVGLRGYKIGGALFSTKHCNFIINEDNATFDDIQSLIMEAQKRVKEEFNIDLHTEIKILK